ncbi:Outer dense fiber protein 2 [Manis javanica]|nr:Outer dense fiber protein 2 [Manis javanica]
MPVLFIGCISGSYKSYAEANSSSNHQLCGTNLSNCAFSWRFPYGKENLLEEETLLTKVMKTRLEVDEVATQLELCGKESKILKDEMNKEIEEVIAKREEAIHQSRLRLEDKTQECGTLARQLEGAIEDARRQADHRYQSQLQDLKDHLEQSESTSRSMQNYVQFLKSSYANLFGDSAYTTYLTSSPIRSRSPPA